MNLESFIQKIYIPNYESILDNILFLTDNCTSKIKIHSLQCEKYSRDQNSRKFFSEMYSYPNYKKNYSQSLL